MKPERPMEQIRENKPNPQARPTNPRGNTSPAGGEPDPNVADPTGRSTESGGAFGKEGVSNRRASVDNTGGGAAENEHTQAQSDLYNSERSIPANKPKDVRGKVE